MNIFRIKKDNNSYVYPIVKVLIFSLLSVAVMSLNQIIVINNKAVYNLFIFLCMIIITGCAHCIFISFGELQAAHKNRAKNKTLTERVIAKSREYSVDEFVSLLERKDVIEIQIIFNRKAIDIGAKSDFNQSNFRFFNKRYYIDKEEFEDIEDFKSALAPYLFNGKILVLSVDGVKSNRSLT